MKRMFALLLVAVLLLCCGCTDKTTPTEKASETAAPETVAPENATPTFETHAPDYVASYPDPLEMLPKDEDGNPVSVVPASPSDPELSNNPTGATDPVAPVPPAEPVNPVVPTEPASGTRVKVWTDDSKYTAFRLPEAKYTRLREGPMTEFEPMQGLGAVYPYAAAPIFSKGADGGYSWLYGYHWGLADQNGRLLTDGIYIDVDSVEYIDYNVEPYESTPLPYWDVTQVQNAQSHTVKEGDYSWSYADGDMLHGLVAKDGSFATPVKYCSLSACSDCVIARTSWEDPKGVDVYDLHGKLLFTGADLPKVSGGSLSLEYGEGLFIASWGRYDGDEYRTENWFLDRTGKQVLGPYAAASAFSDGLACVSLDGTTYGYIDKTGAWVIEPQFTYSSSFRDGQAILEIDETQCVIDKTGRTVFSAEPGDYLTRTEFGYLLERWTEFSSKQVCCDFTGKVLRELETDGSWWRQLTGGMFYSSDGEQVTICSVFDPDKSFTARGDYVQPTYALKDGKPVFGFQIVGWEAERYTFVTEDLSESWAMTDLSYYNSGYLGFQKKLDPVTGKEIKMISDHGRVSAFDENDRLIGSCPSSTDAAVVNGLLRTITDFACTYTDAAGKTILCCPLATALDD